jgi:hypothetical protein
MSFTQKKLARSSIPGHMDTFKALVGKLKHTWGHGVRPCSGAVRARDRQGRREDQGGAREGRPERVPAGVGPGSGRTRRVCHVGGRGLHSSTFQLNLSRF